jgi:hypothetical protein
METGQLMSQTLSEYLRELDERSRCNTADPRQNVGAYEPIPNRGGRSGQSLREVLEELHVNRQSSARIGLEVRVSEDIPGALQEDETNASVSNVNRVLAVSVPAGESADLSRTAEQMVFNSDLGSMEMARFFDSSHMRVRLNELQTRLGIRTSKDIFEDLQRENEERSAREGVESSRKQVRPATNGLSSEGADFSRKRVRPPTNGLSSEGGMEERSRKRVQRARVERSESAEVNASQEEAVAAIIRALDEEFEEKERQSYGSVWCEPIPHERKVSTVREFYNAFHDAETLPIQTCTICYRKFAIAELEEVESIQSMLANLRARYGSQFDCRLCSTLRKMSLDVRNA